MTALILVSIVLLVLLRLLGPRPERDSCSRSLRVGDQVGAVIALALGFAFLISSMASAAPSGAALKFDSIRPSVARDQKSKSGVLLEGTLSQCTIRSNGATGFISSSLSFFRQYEYDGSVRSDARPVVTADYAVTLGVRGRALRSGHHRYDGPPLLRVSHAGMATKTLPSAEAEAQAAAAQMRAAGGNRPTMTSAAVDTTTGKVYTGTSGYKGPVPPEINLPNPSMTRWTAANCAEVAACSAAIADGAQLGNLEVVTVRTATGEVVAPCANCQTWVPGKK